MDRVNSELKMIAGGNHEEIMLYIAKRSLSSAAEVSFIRRGNLT